jgi:hypothetical protein
MTLAAALAGDTDAVLALLESDEGLAQLLAHAGHERAPLAPAFAAVLAAQRPPRAWRGWWEAGADAWASEHFDDDGDVARRVARTSAWALRSLASGLGADDPLALEATILALDEEEDPRPEPVRAVLAVAEHAWPRSELPGAAHLVLAHRAIARLDAAVHDHLDDAAAHLARTTPGALVSIGRLDVALRMVAGRHLDAIQLFARVCARSGERAGSLAAPLAERIAPRPRAATTPLERAEDELALIVRWADEGTPEWVRGLGTLGMRLSRIGDPRAARVLQAFDEGLDRVAASDRAAGFAEGEEDDLAVVERQLRERGETEAADLAARRR